MKAKAREKKKIIKKTLVKNRKEVDNISLQTIFQINLSVDSNRLLNSTRDTVVDIKNNTEYDPGWIQNGGLFIARNKVRSKIQRDSHLNDMILSKKITFSPLFVLSNFRFVWMSINVWPQLLKCMVLSMQC